MKASEFRQQCLDLLYRLNGGLMRLQISGEASENYGAITDPECEVLHTRAGEAVFPFAVAWKHSGEERYFEAARAVGDWLLSEQNEEGSWYETPGRWRGTTTDQLLALCCALPLMAARLGPAREGRWRASINRAADFLTDFIGEESAHINYCATTAASLAAAFGVTREPRHGEKAGQLARAIVSEKVNEDLIIIGEGHREHGAVLGADPGYNIDMTLWSLALYARLMQDGEIERAAARSLQAHLPFVYPDGSIDNSWGVRSNKWTTYGSKTAHGAQATFSMLAGHDPRFRTAASRTLGYLSTMVHGGLVGYGPQWWERSDSACIYPTFTRASNLALAIEFGEQMEGEEALLPCDEPFSKMYSSLGVVLIRTKGLMGTVTAYHYKDPAGALKSKYMSRPVGGCVSNLWFDGYGWLQAASQSRYRRWERMHFPEAGALLPLGPRIEQLRGNRIYSSLNEFDSPIALDGGADNPTVLSSGHLRDIGGRKSSVSYQWRHVFGDRWVQKEVSLKAGILGAKVRIVEPVIEYPGQTVERPDARTVVIRNGRGAFRVEIEDGEATLVAGGEKASYWWPFPALQGFPITLALPRIGSRAERRVRYRLEKLA